ncbi:MAG: methionyl-tRNA formyltransferase, partial [Clostridiales bacterium]|nr:methionyl-tRNA formyltransferase [Clostridiales bacterium]
MRIVFMGTPEYAAIALEEIILAGHQVILVVTQPDKPKGRGKEMQMSAVKECAIKYNLPVFQPVKVKTQEAVMFLKEYEADVFVVAAFGQILSKEILNMPQYGCINIHASLLPKYRGAAPIQWAIIDGEKTTGITAMQMDEGIDTGDMLDKAEVSIEEKETADSLFDKLSQTGAKLIVKVLKQLEQGPIQGEKQDDSLSNYAKRIDKSFGRIDWNKSAVTIERLIRGLNSWPSAYTTLENSLLKIWEADVIMEDEEDNTNFTDAEIQNGTITDVLKDGIVVKTGDGSLIIRTLQLEGRKR